MRSSRALDCCEDILDNIERIHQHQARRIEAAEDERLVNDAVERCLERICEAVHRLTRGGVYLDSLEPTVAWADIRGFGNRLRHEYDAVEADPVRTALVLLPDPHQAALRLYAHFERLHANDRPMA